MRYGHGPSGMKGITFNEKSLDGWAKSLHMSSIMEKSLLDLKESETTIEEGASRIKEDGKYREKIRNFLSTCIHLFGAEDHPPEIVNIHSGKLSNKDVNVDKCFAIGREQVNRFHEGLRNFISHFQS